MPRPRSKQELIELSQENYQELLDFINSFSESEKKSVFPKGTLNRNIRDVLAHLHHWHLLFLSWYEVGMKGEKPEMPAKGYTWKTTKELNQCIWKKYQKTSLKSTVIMLKESYATIQKIIQQHTDEELFTKKRYKWTGTTSLGSYLVSATSSHYDWAYKFIKKQLKASIKK